MNYPLDAIITNEILDAIYLVYLEDTKLGKLPHENIVKAVEPLMPAIDKLYGNKNDIHYIAYLIEAACIKLETLEKAIKHVFR